MAARIFTIYLLSLTHISETRLLWLNPFGRKFVVVLVLFVGLKGCRHFDSKNLGKDNFQRSSSNTIIQPVMALQNA